MSEAKYVYSSCTGVVYLSSIKGLNYETCSQCGDSDEYLGMVLTINGLRKLLKAERYNTEYTEKIVKEAIKYDGIKE